MQIIRSKKLNEKLNQICFPVKATNRDSNFGRFYEKRIKFITLELILNALNINNWVVKIEPWIGGATIDPNNMMNFGDRNDYSFNWCYCKDFNNQTIETQETIFKIFKIL